MKYTYQTDPQRKVLKSMLKVFIFISCLFTLQLYSKETKPLEHESKHLNIEIRKIKSSRPVYERFCNIFPKECGFKTRSIISRISQDELERKLRKVNISVNESVKFLLDKINYDEEEFWSLPINKFGDCEDNALEKRRILVSLGFDKGALSMATVFHREKFYAHAVLLVETQFGTYVLDQDTDELLLWYQTNYIFESREIENGAWEYFVQDW